MAEAAADEETGPPPGVESVFLTGKSQKGKARADEVDVVQENRYSNAAGTNALSRAPTHIFREYLTLFNLFRAGTTLKLVGIEDMGTNFRPDKPPLSFPKLHRCTSQNVYLPSANASILPSIAFVFS